MNKQNLSGTLQTEQIVIIANDPKHTQKIKVEFPTQKRFEKLCSRIRSENGKYQAIVESVEKVFESGQKCARIRAKNPHQAQSISNAFRNKARHGAKWHSRTNYQYVLVESTEK